MYLKSLDIHGFKSFADKTKFEFHPNGVTGIVGPNGCGKSNVVDSIRWVLGETSAKALRGGEMADVIFKGTDKTGQNRSRGASGMAEVTLTLADCEEALNIDFNEVAITRRVYRDGKSEYRINGTLCRLRDIHELFMDTGIGRTSYSIMEQGKIDMLLSSKPEDRRMVFEEAAGITKFKKEKKEALRKLEYTEVNLLRISDVLVEQERRLNSLKRQVAKARRYQALAKDVAILDTHLAYQKYTEYRAELAKLENAIRLLEVRESELEEGLPAKESAVIEARDAAQHLEAELSEIRQQLNHHNNAARSAESRIAFNQENQADLEARIEQNRVEIEDAKRKLNQQKVDFEEAEKMLVDLSARIESKQAQLAEFESRAAELRVEREERETALRNVRGEANQTQAQVAASQAKIESAMSQMENSRERARRLSEEFDRLQGEREEAELALAKIVSDLEGWVEKLGVLQEEKKVAERAFQHTRGDVDATREQATQSHKELTRVASRRDALRQLVSSGEGFEKGTQSVLKGLDEPEFFKNGVRGVLAEFIEVEGDYTLPVESALGANLEAVLVSDSTYIQAIIDRLTQRKLGRAAIISEDFVAPKTHFQRLTLPDGAEAWAMDRVKFDPKVGSLVEALLANVLIVKDLSTALELRGELSGVTLVTMLGEVSRADGIVSGGAGKGGQSSVLDRQNEVRRLDAEVLELEVKDEEARVRLSHLEQKLSEQREAVDLARERLQQAHVEESTLKGQLSLAKREVESLQNKISSVEWEVNDIKQREGEANDGLEGYEMDLATARARLEQFEMDQARLVAELEETSRREGEAVAMLQEFRTTLAVERQAMEAAERQRSPMAARLEELLQISRRRDEEIVGFSERIKKAQAENQSLKEAAETHRAEARGLEELLEATSASRGALHEAIEVSEKSLAALRHELAGITEQKGRDEVASTKINLRLENLIEQVMERHQIELAYFKRNMGAFFTCLQSRAQAYSRNSQHGADFSEVSGSSRSDGDSPDWELVEKMVSDLKRKLDLMGPVNIDAIEEFEELEVVHNDLRTQHDDLVHSKTELELVIEKINVETKKRFVETFDQVAQNFKGMFKVLFGEKAVANLVLLDESDPLESGIDIIAKPPGKKLQSITLLSGGERSMTAVALLFSIFQIKPSPFCVLDELDAPLDEANIGRFLKVLDQFINRSQFIIVTHSKRTMHRADIIYGVTMEDFGVSKPVGMKLTDANNAQKGEARTAAQKAALELDA